MYSTFAPLFASWEGGLAPALHVSKLTTFASWEGGLAPALHVTKLATFASPEGGLAPALSHMSKKWTNENIPGALHYATGNVDKRRQIFLREQNCITFLEELHSLIERREAKLICFAIMPDHFHLIANPRDGDIQTWIGELKSFSAKSLVRLQPVNFFLKPDGDNQVWQESFKSLALWSSWMIWQKINYIHSNPLRAGLAESTMDLSVVEFPVVLQSSL